MYRKAFSFEDLFEILRKRWWVMLLAGALVASLAGVYSIKTYNPTYRAVTTFFVKSEKSVSSSSQEEAASLNWAQKIVNTYTTLLRTNDFSKALADEYSEMFNGDKAGAEDYKKVKSMITATPQEETNLFKLSFEASSAELAFNYAQAAEELTPKFIDGITKIHEADVIDNTTDETADTEELTETATDEISPDKYSISIADHAVLPRMPINGDNLTRNTLIGFVVGAVLVFLVFFFIDLFDVRIKSEEDLISNYTLPVIGTVPSFEASTNRKKVYKYGN